MTYALIAAAVVLVAALFAAAVWVDRIEAKLLEHEERKEGSKP